jgi:hypothetical protein
MITGTYDIQVTNVYTNPATLTPSFTGPEWQLFRSHLRDTRKEWQGDNAGVFVDRVGQFESYPIDGPVLGKPSLVESLGAAYIEFFPTTLPLTRTADLTITFWLRVPAGCAPPKLAFYRLPTLEQHPTLATVLYNRRFNGKGRMRFIHLLRPCEIFTI